MKQPTKEQSVVYTFNKKNLNLNPIDWKFYHPTKFELTLYNVLQLFTKGYWKRKRETLKLKRAVEKATQANCECLQFGVIRKGSHTLRRYVNGAEAPSLSLSICDGNFRENGNFGYELCESKEVSKEKFLERLYSINLVELDATGYDFGNSVLKYDAQFKVNLVKKGTYKWQTVIDEIHRNEFFIIKELRESETTCYLNSLLQEL